MLVDDLLRLRHRLRRRRCGESQQHVRRLDLLPLAGHGLDLQRCVVIGEECPGLQLAVVLEQHIHAQRMQRKGR